MANAAIATLVMQMTANETIGAGSPDINPPYGQSVVHNGLNLNATPLNANTVPDVMQCSYGTYTLSSGTINVDMTNLQGTNGATVNGTGLRVIAVLINVPSANGAIITITPGVSNGYTLFGTSSSLRFDPGDYDMIYKQTTSPAISSSAKILTLTGTGSSDNLEIGFLLG